MPSLPRHPTLNHWLTGRGNDSKAFANAQATTFCDHKGDMLLVRMMVKPWDHLNSPFAGQTGRAICPAYSTGIVLFVRLILSNLWRDMTPSNDLPKIRSKSSSS
jgi:hypothetical protein